MRFFQWCKSTILKLSFVQKLVFSYVLFLLVPLSAITMFSYFFQSSQLRQQTIFSANQVYANCYNEIQTEVEHAHDALKKIVTNETFLRFLASSQNSATQYAERYGDYLTIYEWINAMQNTESKIKAYITPYFYYLVDNMTTFSYGEFVESDEYLSLDGFNEKWFVNDNSISLTKLIQDPWNLKEDIGAVEVEIPNTVATQAMEYSLFNESCTAILLHQDSKALLSGVDIDWKGILSNEYIDSEYENWNIYEYDGQSYFVRQQVFSDDSWSFVYFVPEHVINNASVSFSYAVWAILFLCIPISYLIAKSISKGQTRRISKLMESMHATKDGSPKRYEGEQGYDEIGALIKTYNKMVDDNATLTEQCFEAGKELKSSELRLLQAQINPHFLYNSLDNINVMAIKNSVPQISAMIKAIITFYKLGLNHGRDIVPLFDEIGQTQAYIDIQNLRYRDAITLQVDIPSSILNCKLPKLTLQPIVENAVIHGIFEKDCHSGVVKIAAKQVCDEIIITISDDGIGIDEKMLETLNNTPQIGVSKHFGVANVSQRLNLLFGPQYLVKFLNLPEGGACAIINIPLT